LSAEPQRAAIPPADDPLFRVGVVVVAHARADLAAGCVRSLPHIPRERVVVVVNDRTAVEPSELHALRESATVVFPEKPQGFAANLNLGVSRLPGGLDYVLLANDDVEFLDESVQKLVETLRADARAGVVGPAVRQVNGKQPPLQPQFPTVLRAALGMAVLPLGPAWDPLSRRAGLIAPDDPVERGRNGWVIGAAMAVRMRAFEDVAGFDEDFFLYYEETDFCYRLRQAGWRILWRPDAPVLHLQGASTAGSGAEDAFFRSERLYFRKRLGPFRSALLELALIVIFALSCVYNAGYALVRPTSGRQRLALLRERWRTRIFLRPSRGRRPHRIDQFAG